MKKVLLLVTLSIFFMSSAFARSPEIGITAGLNVSNTTRFSDNSFKAGFQAGWVVDFGITDNFSIIPELLFSQRGYKNKNIHLVDFQGNIIVEKTVRETFNYLQIPINAAYKFDAGTDSKIIVFTGPYLGNALSANVNGASIAIGSNGYLKRCINEKHEYCRYCELSARSFFNALSADFRRFVIQFRDSIVFSKNQLPDRPLLRR